MQSPVLHALNTVFTSAHICGSRHCLEYANDLVVRGVAWPVAAIVCAIILMAPSIVSNMASSRVWHALDTRYRVL